MTSELSASFSCSTLRSQVDTSPTKHPAIRSLKTSRREEISDGFDSLSGLLSDLRSAQDDAQQEVTRALTERDKLLTCLQRKDDHDERMQDFLSQLNVAESRCSNLHDQLDYMKKMYKGGERCSRRARSPAGTGDRCSRSPAARQCSRRRRRSSAGHRSSRSPAANRSSRSSASCQNTSPKRVQQYIVQRRRSLSTSTHPQTSRSPPACRRQNTSSPSLRNSQPATSRSPPRRRPVAGKPQTKQGLRLRAESLIRQTGGRRDDTDGDGDHLWGDKRRRSKSRSNCGILANASKYVPGSVQELRARSRAASLASRASCSPPRRQPCRDPCRSRRRAASESIGRRGDSGIDSDSESPSRLVRQAAERERRAAAAAAAAAGRSQRGDGGRAPLPFLSSSNTGKSHHIGANIQHVMSLAKQTGGCTRSGAPLPDIKIGRLPQRAPFLRYRRRKPFRYHDQMEIDKYKIEVDPRSCGPDNTADFARYKRDRQGCPRELDVPPPPPPRRAYRAAPKYYDDDETRSTASAQAQKMLCNPATLRRTKRSLKQLLEELAEEFAGLECVCQRLETDMGRADGSVDRGELEQQIGRLEMMMEERRRQVCCLLKLYKQIKRLSRASGGQEGGGGCRTRRPCARRGTAARSGRGMRVNTRVQPNSVRPRGVTFSMQKSFPLRPLQPRARTTQPRVRRLAAPRSVVPLHGTELKVLRDMRNIQRRIRIDMGDEY